MSSTNKSRTLTVNTFSVRVTLIGSTVKAVGYDIMHNEAWDIIDSEYKDYDTALIEYYKVINKYKVRSNDIKE